MIKAVLNTIITVSAILLLTSCAKEKNESQPLPLSPPIEVKDSVATAAEPEYPAPKSTNKDTIAKYSPVADPKAIGCQILRKGTFTYKDTDGDPVIVKIVDDVSTEEHKGGKYMIMSQLKWTSECEYENMLILSTVPKVRLEPGTVMNVTIDKVEGNNIYFTATALGKSYHNKLTKVK